MITAPDRNRLTVVDSGDDVSALQQVVALDHFRRTGNGSRSISSRGSRSRGGDEGDPTPPVHNNNSQDGEGDGDGGGGGGGGGGSVNNTPTSCPTIFGPHVGGESVANITKRMMSLVPLPGGAGT